MNRRRFMTCGGGALVSLAGGGMFSRSLAQEGNASRNMITGPTQRAIDSGLRWLAQEQVRVGDRDGAFGTGPLQGNVAVTSLAGLAFMSDGNQPGRGHYGDVVTRAVRYIIRNENRVNHDGFLSAARAGFHGGPMYGHGFATLFLAEVYGMVNEPGLRNELRATLGRAVQLIIRSQNNLGGWRYQPMAIPGDADISVTICQIMALRAARNAGIAVPKSVADRCTDYVKRCQDPVSGGFRYQHHGHGQPGFARTAAGVVALNSAGIYDGDSVRKGLDYLLQFRPRGGGGGGNNFLGFAEHYYYGHYYAVQAMWLAGRHYWTQWYPAIRDELLASRRNDFWPGGVTCPNYSTAMALIILQVPNNYLPILQR